MKYVNIVLVAVGVLVIAQTLRVTFWGTTPTATQPIEITSPPPSEVESLPLPPSPAPPERSVTRPRPLGTPGTSQTSRSGQEDLQDRPSKLPPASQTDLPTPSLSRPGETPNSGPPTGAGQPASLQPPGPGADSLFSPELEEAKRGPEEEEEEEEEEEDSPSPPPVRGSMPEGQ